MSLLLIEDDAFYAQFISELLADRKISATLVTSAEEALALNIDDYDSAIIDIMLPNDPEKSGVSVEESRGGFSTGVAVARRLRQKKPDIKIVVMTSDLTGVDAESWAKDHSIPFVRKDEGPGALLRALGHLGVGTDSETTPLAFIIHGHDETALMELKDFIQNTLKWREPVVLREQPSSGKTIIEKFEQYSSLVDFVFVLLTPDDTIHAPGATSDKRRSRQNVVFEMGFFYGSLGRRSGRILLLHKGPTELPSDIAGVVYVNIDAGVKAAGEQIRKEVVPHVK
jgi:CheY-like chemotaxis protein